MARSASCSWLLLLVIALALAPCGVAHAQQRVAASYPGIAGYNIPFWVALDAGEFKKAGLQVDPVLISGGSKSMQALLSGGLDFAHVSGEGQGFSRLGDLNAMGMRYPELSIVTRKRDLKERRDLVRRYLRAYVDAVRKMKNNREMTVRMIEKYIHVGSKMEAIKTYDYFARSISDTLRTER